MYRVCVSSRNWCWHECDILKGEAPVGFDLDIGAGASEASPTNSLLACYLVSTFSYASLPAVSVFYRPVCTSCTHVFVDALPLTSTHRRALLQVHLSYSSVLATWASHNVTRKIADVSNPAARDRTVPHREQGRARFVPTYSSKLVLSLERSVATYGTLAASVVSPPKLLGTHARNSARNIPDRRLQVAAVPDVGLPTSFSQLCPYAPLILRIFEFPGIGQIYGVRKLLATLMSLSKKPPRDVDEAIKNFLDSLMSRQEVDIPKGVGFSVSGAVRLGPELLVLNQEQQDYVAARVGWFQSLLDVDRNLHDDRSS